jgi:hypothetical protein
MIPLLVMVVAVRLWDPSASVPPVPVLTLVAEKVSLNVKVPEVTVRVPPEENVNPLGAVGLVPGPVGFITTISTGAGDDGGTMDPVQLVLVAQILSVYPFHSYVTPHPSPAQKTRIPATVKNFFM